MTIISLKHGNRKEILSLNHVYFGLNVYLGLCLDRLNESIGIFLNKF